MRIVTVLFALFSAVVVSMGLARVANPGPLSGPTPLCPTRTCALAR